MKKINLILGAVAAVALLASCSNGSKDLENVKNHNYRYAYTVTGSKTTTDKSGTTAAYTTYKTVQTIKTAVANCTYSEDALNDSNYDYYSISINGKADYEYTVTPSGATTSTTVKASGKFGDVSFYYTTARPAIPAQPAVTFTVPSGVTAGEGWYNMLEISNPLDENEWNAAFIGSEEPEVSASVYPIYWNGTSSEVEVIPAQPGSPAIEEGYTSRVDHEGVSFGIQDFDGDYFIQFNNEFIALPEDAFDGFIGDDEFTLTFSTTQDNRSYLNETDHTNAANALSTTDVDYKLTFKLVEAE